MIISELPLLGAIMLALVSTILVKVKKPRNNVINYVLVVVLTCTLSGLFNHYVQLSIIPIIFASVAVKAPKQSQYHEVKYYDSAYLYRIYRGLQRCKSTSDVKKILNSMPSIKVTILNTSDITKSIDIILDVPGSIEDKVKCLRMFSRKLFFVNEGEKAYTWSYIVLNKSLESIDKAIAIVNALEGDNSFNEIAENILLMTCDERWKSSLDKATRSIIYLNVIKLLRRRNNIPSHILTIVIPNFLNEIKVSELPSNLNRKVIEETISLYSHICSINPSDKVKIGLIKLLKSINCKLTLNKIMGEAILECRDIDLKVHKEEWFSLVNCI